MIVDVDRADAGTDGRAVGSGGAGNRVKPATVCSRGGGDRLDGPVSAIPALGERCGRLGNVGFVVSDGGACIGRCARDS